MSRMPSWIAVVSILALVTPMPAMAEIRLQRKVEERPRKAATKAPRRAPKKNRTAPAPEPEAPQAPSGIDPAVMKDAIAEAKYTVSLVQEPEAKKAALQVTDGKIGWSVNFSDCVDESHCGTMEFYTLWSVSNEANVCAAWVSDVTKDLNRTQGKPSCYTVASLPKQFHLRLSSNQVPYYGMDKLPPEEAKARMVEMINVWSAHLPMLQEAWKIARIKCPRATDSCK
ncbi:hypothetical protein [Novosphingobium album (ex Liu et al. 2023)]|uniref:Uncharacterized protein n=1 Tax=Novosphingobium album (ex Liu et al. 2023) TaxID=3031130 RepID=A0ABT5WV13_9SPHN|nr:hypothetical protein [Novosphingobium album (ex Liu et al. 2023)]MDE8653692.1 hypothetical protein [Novosphingobium album (ex Liu et al. 2023)]